VCRFVEDALVHGPGSYEGRPFLLHPWQRDFLMRLYARDADGRRVINRACLLTPKGAGKTELAGAIAVVELVVRPSASVVIAAASWDQARTLFESAVGVCSTPSPLAGLIDVTEAEIRLKGTTSRILRVAGEGPANDGLRPTCVIRDEVHEWNQPKRAENYQILDAGGAKRGGLGIDISTVGADRDSLLGRICDYGEQVADGVVDDPGFLFVYHGAEGHLDGLDLSDDDVLREEIRFANPSASGERAFVDVDAMVRTFRDLPPGRAKRYILNVWGAGGDEQWLPEGRWEQLADPGRTVEPGTKVYAGFDGSQYRDSTAVVCVTADGRETPRLQGRWLREDGGEPEPMIKYPPEPPPAKPHVFVPGVFEPVGGEIDRPAVDKTVRDMFATYDVVAMWCDPFGWFEEIGKWQADFGEERVVKFPTNRHSKWAEPCNLTWSMVKDGELTHDGNEALARHLRNAVPHKSPTRETATFGKSHPESSKKVDAAVALTLALGARHKTPAPIDITESVW
jgi:phage terminase large subunit-like protein